MYLSLKQIFKKVCSVNYNKILSSIFLLIIFFVGIVSLPRGLYETGRFLLAGKTDIISLINKIDYEGGDNFDAKWVGQGENIKNSFINLNGLIARYMGQRCVNNVIKLDNGHLYSLYSKEKEKDLFFSATQITKLCNMQKENGGHFLFVLAPSQIPKYDSIIPIGYNDYLNQDSDELLCLLRLKKVPILDLRDEMVNDNLRHSDAFFVTDLHWKPETGFWAYTKIMNYLSQSGIIEPISSLYSDINEYNIDVYKDFFLGYYGKRTGIYYAGIDDFAVITPKYKTDLSVEIPSKKIFKQGAFKDVMIDYSMIKKDYFSMNPYSGYGYGNQGLKIYRNENAPIDLKVLSIRDSFANASTTFLPLVINTCDEIDMRHYIGNFMEYYTEFQPDIIIILVHSAVNKNTTYDFFADQQE